MLLDPGQPAFILLMRCHTEKMERPERPSDHCKLIPLQLWIVQTAPNAEKSFAWPANRPHHSEGSFFRAVFGRGETARSGAGQQLWHVESREANSGPVGIVGALNSAGDPVSRLVCSSTLRRRLEVKSTLVSSF